MVTRRATTDAFEKAASARDRERVSLRLYIAGNSPRSSRALSLIKELCEKHFAGRYDLEVIDVYQQPARARTDQIVATPTLVRDRPAPVRKLVGDMTDRARVLRGLGLDNTRRTTDARSAKTTQRTRQR